MELLTCAILLTLGMLALVLRRRTAIPKRIPHLDVGFRCLMKLRLSTICSRAYAECRRRGLPLASIRLFLRPVVFVAEPRLVLQVASNWQHFRNRGSYHSDPTNAENMHLFNMKDARWKAARKDLAKFFTTDRLKHAVEVFDAHARRCLEGLRSAGERSAVDMFEVAHTFAHSVASHMFLSRNLAATRRPPSTNASIRTNVFAKLYNPGWFNRFVDVFGYVCPSVLRWFGVCDIPAEVFQHLRDVLTQADETAQDNGTNREQMIGYMIGLFVGSLKATTTFISHACYELAKAPHLQQRLRDEIQALLTVNNNGDGYDNIAYEELQEMTFMRHVLNETLRLHSGGPLLIRECSITTTLTIDDLSNVQIPSGTLLFASLRDILRDEAYFPAAHTFNPDRFEDLPQVPEFFWPFGLSRHACIGNKFVFLQAQVFLIRLLTTYKIRLDEKCAESCRFHAGTRDKRLTDGIIFLNFTLHNTAGNV